MCGMLRRARILKSASRRRRLARRRAMISTDRRRMPRKILKIREETPAALPTETAQARRFGKARSAQSSALLEDYVELIDDLLGCTGEARPTDIARRLGVSHATAIKAIARLKREGVATARPYRGVFLTDSGQALAARVRARHRL